MHRNFNKQILRAESWEFISAAPLHSLTLHSSFYSPPHFAFPFRPSGAGGPALPLLYTERCTLRRPELVVCPSLWQQNPHVSTLQALDGQTLPFSTIISLHLLVLLHNNMQILTFVYTFFIYFWLEYDKCMKTCYEMMYLHVIPSPSPDIYVLPLPLPLSSGPHIPTPQLQAEDGWSHSAGNALWAVMEAHISTWHETLSLVY